jgi:hypothetical protein
MKEPQDIDAQELDAYDPKLLTTLPGDYVYATGVGALSLILSALIPGGGIVAALVGVNQLSPMWKRLDKWMVYVQQAINELKRDGLTIEELVKEDAFVTALLRTSEVALKNHQTEKLEALRNALLNVALGTQPNENKQQTFLTLIDDLTPDDVRLLAFFDNTAEHLGRMGLHKSDVLLDNVNRAFPELQDQEGYVLMIIATLYGRGLVVGDVFQPADIANAYPTAMAKEFLAFIRSPFDATK